MNGLKAIIFITGMVAVCVPWTQGVQAFSVHTLGTGKAIHASYPLPAAKPALQDSACERITYHADQDDLNKKQAMAAALGLYLGVKMAMAPSSNESLQKCAR